MATRTPRLLLTCVGAALLVAALVGCGAPSTPAGSSKRAPQLACALGATVQPIDTVGLTLSCTVTNAPVTETAFTVHDTFVNKAGKSYTLAPRRVVAHSSAAADTARSAIPCWLRSY